ncbi:hypothetical protein RQP46_005811 [Phenoliferia psychrophenolica]
MSSPEPMRPTLHHLNNSQSQRCVWLLEELAIPYTLVTHIRDAVTVLAPPSLRDATPLGKSPTLVTSEGAVIIESSAILAYLIRTYDHDKKFQGAGLVGHDALKLFTALGAISDNTGGKFIEPRLTSGIAFLEAELGDQDYFMGTEPGRPDFMLSWPLWSTHKLICKPDAPLVFAQPALSKREFDDFRYNFGTIDEEAGGVTGFNLVHHTTAPEAENLRVDAGKHVRMNRATGEIGLHGQGEILWMLHKQRVEQTPLPGQNDIKGGARSWLQRHHPEKSTTSIKPFYLMGLVSVRYEKNNSGVQDKDDDRPLSRLAHLDSAARNAFELQALVVCTLLDRRAKDDLIALALVRLKEEAGEDTAAGEVWTTLVGVVEGVQAARAEAELKGYESD